MAYLLIRNPLHALQLDGSPGPHGLHGNTSQVGRLLVVERDVELVHEARGHARLLGHDVPRHIGVERHLQEAEGGLKTGEVVELGVRCSGETNQLNEISKLGLDV